MRIVVTGKDGQLARCLDETLIHHDAVFAVRPAFDLADFASIEACVATVRPNLVISAAAYTAVDKAEDEPELAMRINGEALGVLGRVCAQQGVPIIHISTDYVFDGSGNRPWRESDAVAPLGVYGRSKLAGEEALTASGADHIILRTAWVYSPFGQNFVKTMLRLAQGRPEISVVDDQIGCPTSALDIAAAIEKVVATWQVQPRHGMNATYHLAGHGEASWADLAEQTFSVSASLGIQSADFPTRATRPANSRLCCNKFADCFGHTMPDWRLSLAKMMPRLLESMVH
jgi:dTDP-4-dehydrorhamnose reductase